MLYGLIPTFVFLFLTSPGISINNDLSSNHRETTYAHTEPENDRAATILGSIIDANTGAPVPFAYLHLEEIQRSTTSDVSGMFQFQNVPSGSYTLHIQRIGYITQTREIEIGNEPSLTIELRLSSTVVTGDAIQVSADDPGLSGSNIAHASSRIAGEELRQNLNSTLSETLQNQPGFAQRSMGAAAGRPVIRGLGDERVLILQDGENSGDVSWASADHAVTIDPSGAEEIEIARGPAALEYGANAIGGVINVVTHRIPNTIPTKVGGTWATQASSNNRGLMSVGAISVPVNSVVINANLSGRTGRNFRSPDGEITNTDIRTVNGTLGTGYIRPWGYVGVSGSGYYSEYGIPPDPDGGHTSGVNIEMRKYQAEGRGELVPAGNSPFSLFELRGSFTNYNHTEFEPGGIIGTEYTMLRSSLAIKGRYDNWGVVDRGIVGLSFDNIDYSVFGSGTPDAASWGGALFAIQESNFQKLHIETGIRLDLNVTRPDNERPNSFIGHVRKRTFRAVSSSVSASIDLGQGFNIGSTFLHSYRPPSLEEIYSEGPHLASYSFEIGNPDLNAERGLATELFTRYNSGENEIGLTLFYNYFNNFIHAQDTGTRNTQFPDLNNYQFIGTEASTYGIELESGWKIIENWFLSGNLSHTIGSRKLTDEERELTGLDKSEQPLPMIPPLSGSAGLQYSFKNISLTGRARYAIEQKRLGEFETETPGYIVFDFNSHVMFDWGATLHTVALNIQNLLNRKYYNHLSRIKEIFPEPGRSVNLLYRVYF